MSDERLSEERLHALDVWAETASYSLALDVRDLIAEVRRARRLELLVSEAMHLHEYGERAPGGDETWAGWYAKTRAALAEEPRA